MAVIVTRETIHKDGTIITETWCTKPWSSVTEVDEQYKAVEQ